MALPAPNSSLPPLDQAVLVVERLKALAVLLASEDVAHSVTNLDGNVATALFEIFECGLADVQLALARMAKTRCGMCGSDQFVNS